MIESPGMILVLAVQKGASRRLSSLPSSAVCELRILRIWLTHINSYLDVMHGYFIQKCKNSGNQSLKNRITF